MVGQGVRGRLELLEYCVPAPCHTRGLPPAVQAGVELGLWVCRTSLRGLALGAPARLHQDFLEARGSSIGPWQVLKKGLWDGSEKVFGMAQCTSGIRK